MVKLFNKFAKKPYLKSITKNWVLISEKTSLSTLENFLHCKKLLKKKKIPKAKLYIFCEQTRIKRVRRLAKRILNVNYISTVIPIDFDVSSNRYLDPEFLARKERLVLKHDLWALESVENLKKYHMLFEKKFEFLRKAGSKNHNQAVREWWKQEIDKLIKKSL